MGIDVLDKQLTRVFELQIDEPLIEDGIRLGAAPQRLAVGDVLGGAEGAVVIQIQAQVNAARLQLRDPQ